MADNYRKSRGEAALSGREPHYPAGGQRQQSRLRCGAPKVPTAAIRRLPPREEATLN
ncbi:hypothetical protein TPA0910_32540 [Streptomyces hygroscopicus subsp. sporocinereus]|uniref:Uncharacterized protein n=1 Tax=Streptomyces hygroscopicus TaxID=1912 RepID=A0ABQ3U0P2_STRHY|nr:hypothetical protein TPA0910_32540 [Streptomyces hygroscopicus]